MKNKISLSILIGACVLVGVFLSPILFDGSKNSEGSLVAQSANPPVKDSPAKNQAVALENAFQDVFDTVSPSVVSIITEKTTKVKNGPLMHPFMEEFGFPPQRGHGQGMPQRGNPLGLGSGIILNSDGYILTNEHVVDGWDKLTVKLKNKKTYEAKVIGFDKTMDLALIKIQPNSDLKPVTLGDSNKVRVGNWSIAIGAPHGFEHSFTVGVVSAIARGGIDKSGLSYIQTDAAINHGNSGGPLLNIHGEIIGINRMIVSPSGGSIGIGFAIPINEAKRIIDEMKTTGKVKHQWIGIRFEPLHEELAKTINTTEKKGVVVMEVINDSPAAIAGLKVQDLIIKLGDKTIESGEDLIDTVLNSKVGKKMEIKIIRKGSPMTLQISTAERPS